MVNKDCEYKTEHGWTVSHLNQDSHGDWVGFATSPDGHVMRACEWHPTGKCNGVAAVYSETVPKFNLVKVKEGFNYHVVMISGGQLRHYELIGISYQDAYDKAQEKDREEYPENHTVGPDATVIQDNSFMNFPL